MNAAERQELINQYEDGYDEVAKALQGFPAQQLFAHGYCFAYTRCSVLSRSSTVRFET